MNTLNPISPTRPFLNTIVRRVAAAAAIAVTTVASWAGDLAFSDPSRIPAPPQWAVGYPQRTSDLDVLPGFQKPPAGFGTVPFYWWLGDQLTTERIEWELSQMSGMGVSGFQINYAHADHGGHSYGSTLPSDPPLFSEQWWRLTGWFLRQAKQQGAAISLSDYALGFGQGWCVDEVLREHPEAIGMVLRADENGKVSVESVPWSLNPLHPMAGKWYADKFFGQFERQFPGESGHGLNFFFSDELRFGVSGKLWSAQFADEFKKRKGYDITPELPALFRDIGPRTPKIRLDYGDVLVSLSEEGYFKPVFDWHQQRGMIMGCDHGGRGRDVIEFGDYFRTQRWNQGPGADQPNLGKNIIKAKVAASIAHLYERPRVWLEGFYGSGWGTTSAGFVDATLTDFVMGYNLLGIHGMYYDTHGGWWEWAPPDNTFRMPYWKHMRGFMECVQRLSYLLSEGHHRCDVAILYPVAAVEAGINGAESVATAFSTAEQLYTKGIDLDFMDFESLDRAKVVGRQLQVSGEVYRVLVLPAMKAIRHSTLQKALEFRRAGGTVIALDALPEASDRLGRDDPEVAAMVKELFPAGICPDLLAALPARDYDGPGIVQHRRIGQRDCYAIYGATAGAEAFFRATGKVELWDPWTGVTRPLEVNAQTSEGTKLKLPLSATEIQLVVFSPGMAKLAIQAQEKRTETIAFEGDWEFELQPTSNNRFGDFHWPATPTMIGAEVRQIWYCEGDKPTGPWRKVTCSFGPQFIQSAGMPPTTDGKPYEFSWRWGIESDPGHQGYHGLKAEVHDEFLGLGQPTERSRLLPSGLKEIARHLPEVVVYTSKGEDSFFSTAIVAPRDLVAYALVGPIAPLEIWLNGERVQGDSLPLKAGPNPLVLRYNKTGRTYFVASLVAPVLTPKPTDSSETTKLVYQEAKMATKWWNDPNILPFDIRATEKSPVGWYRFVAPPGLSSFQLSARGKVEVSVDNNPVDGQGRYVLPQPSSKPVTVMLRIEHERGFYGGAALSEPIKLDCRPGMIAPGDWSQIDGLNSYSGGAWYRKTFALGEAQVHGRVILDLGNVADSAELRVNGRLVGVRVSPPWSWDLTGLVKAGSNRIEVLVCNSLANHYVTVPTRYRGELTSGLLGPVTLQVEP